MNELNRSEWSEGKHLLATVTYFDVFDLALNIDDLVRLKLGKKVDFDDLIRLIGENNKFLRVINNQIVLRGREDLVERSVKCQEVTNMFLKDVRKWSWWFRLIPFVDGVAVCNYLPLGVVDEHSDIDLFVITSKNRIFTARFLLTIFTQLLGKRRHGRKVEGRYCLSFYASENDLNFEELLLDKNDIYFAYWVLALYPVFGEKKLWKRLIDENWVWGKRFFLDWQNHFSMPESVLLKSLSRRMIEYLLKGKFGDIFEHYLAKFFQKRYARKKPSLPENASVVVNNRWLKYHNNDRRQYFRKEWYKRLKGVGIFS